MANDNDEDESSTMLIVSHGKSYTVSDARPKKLIMSTLARAAIERDKEMEEAEQALPAAPTPQATPAVNESRMNTAARRAPAATSSVGSPSPARQVTFEGDQQQCNSPRPTPTAAAAAVAESSIEIDASSHVRKEH